MLVRVLKKKLLKLLTRMPCAHKVQRSQKVITMASGIVEQMPNGRQKDEETQNEALLQKIDT